MTFSADRGRHCTATALGANAARVAAAKRKRYVSVGVGSRSRMYQERHLGSAQGSMASWSRSCDTNPGRLELCRQAAPNAAGAKPPKPYLAADFDKMVRETKPDVVIVTTLDAFHDEYIVRAMDAGLRRHHRKADDHHRREGQRILDAASAPGGTSASPSTTATRRSAPR